MTSTVDTANTYGTSHVRLTQIVRALDRTVTARSFTKACSLKRGKDSHVAGRLDAHRAEDSAHANFRGQTSLSAVLSIR